MLGVYESLALEDGEGVSDGHPGNSVVLDKLSFGGQFGALGEPPTVDGLAQLVGDLSEDRTIARGVEITEQAGWE
ncbi:hypothetical protein GCM10023084_64020 [Streptomyces lacrimifluminis]